MIGHCESIWIVFSLKGQMHCVSRRRGRCEYTCGKTLKVISFTSETVLNETDADMLAIVKSGKGKMSAWHDKLSDDQMKELIEFVHTLQKKQ